MTLETVEVDGAESGERWMLPAEVEWSYLEWAEGSRAEAGGAAPPNAAELVDQPPFYAAAIGARAGALPSGKTPLVGLAVLGYVGDSVVDAVLFFELARSATASPPVKAQADAVVVVPAIGDLVIDVLESISAESSRDAKDRWRTTRASALVRHLARGAQLH